VDIGETSRVLNREIFLLIALAGIAIGVFGFTRSMAAKEQQMEGRIAAIWYSRGERELDAGQIEKAIESLRRATAHARENRIYMLALANALAAGNHTAEAQQALLRLRESDPEDAQINLYLARLTAKRGEIPEAIHYYQNALYGRWTGSQIDERRRQLRLELIGFLLDQQDRNRALSELLILETDLPRSAPYRIQVAKLFLQAGDAPNALKNFTEAIRLDPHNGYALTGAGEVAFQLGNYPAAQHYLKTALAWNPESGQAQQLLSLTQMVLNDDPLAPHVTSEERRRRLLLDFQQSLARLDSCTGKSPDPKTIAELQDLKDKAVAMDTQLQSPKLVPDSEFSASAVELIYEIEKTSAASCGTPAGLDQALLLVGQKHGGG
jgi:tetratricopeptide (TPR) repeat protein